MRYFFLTFFFVLLVVAGQPSINAQSNNLHITEINFAGSTSSSKCKTVDFATDRCGFDKWIEITNTSNELIDISGFKIFSRAGVGSNEQFVFPNQTGVTAGGSIVIGYTERNFSSVLSESGVGVDFISYSMLRISNNETHQIKVKLVDSSDRVIDPVDIDTSQFIPKEYNYSLSNVNGEWVETSDIFYPNNHGTPRVGGLITIENIPESISKPNAITVFSATESSVEVPSVSVMPTNLEVATSAEKIKYTVPIISTTTPQLKTVYELHKTQSPTLPGTLSDTIIQITNNNEMQLDTIITATQPSYLY